MQKLEIKNKFAIFLNHKNLIDEEYLESGNGNISYVTKAEIFDFKQRSTCEKKNEKKMVKNTLELSPTNIHLHEWLNLSTEFLKLLHKSGEFNKANFSLVELQRCWEEVHEFPQFHGANHTTNFQTFNFQHKNITYIIPPQCSFYNHDLMQIVKLMPQLISNTNGYDIIILDPPWRNKYIRRVKKMRLEHAYSMLDVEELSILPLPQLMHKHSIVAIWCTNSTRLQETLVEKLLPLWKLKLLHSLPWFKINTSGELISEIKNIGHKQPFEMLYIATNASNDEVKLGEEFRKISILLSVPSIIHSHKPPLLPWLRDFLPSTITKPRFLELFARYLQPNCTSVGLEVLKLMDSRLYNKISLPQKIVLNET